MRVEVSTFMSAQAAKRIEALQIHGLGPGGNKPLQPARDEVDDHDELEETSDEESGMDSGQGRYSSHIFSPYCVFAFAETSAE